MRLMGVLWILLLIALLVFVAACSLNDQSERVQVIINTDQGAVVVDARTADTIEQQKFGLMNVSYILPNEGMLFRFNDSKVRSFWMKDTLIPLDMMFINDKNQVVYVVDSAQPAKEEPYSIYSSQVPVSSVLEVNAGFSKRYGVKVGDSITW